MTWRKRRTIRQVVIDLGKTIFWSSVILTLFDPNSWFGLGEYLKIRPYDLLISVGILASVLFMFTGLQRSHPIFMWSIMSFILHHMNKSGTENPTQAGTAPKTSFIEQGQFDPESGNAGSVIHLLFTNASTRIPFVFMMVLALPSIVKFEEEYFRNGTDSWFEGVIRSVLFGMVHFLLGFVPLGAALSLSLAGIILTEVYMNQGLEASITLHLAYDSMIILPIAIGVLLGPLVSKVPQRMEPEVLDA